MDYLMAFLVLLLLTDAVLTMVIIKRGIGYEANPLLKKLDVWLRSLGWGARWGWLVASKGLVLGLLWLFDALGYTRLPEGGVLLGLLTAWYLLIVVSNFRVLRGGRSFFQ